MAARFWDVFEEELIVSVKKNPEEYWLGPEESAESYAHRTRMKMQTSGMRACNHNSTTFRRLAKRMGIPFTIKALIACAESPRD